MSSKISAENKINKWNAIRAFGKNKYPKSRRILGIYFFQKP